MEAIAVPEAEPKLWVVTGSFTICAACLDGEGGECHTPGCIMWLNRAPDLSIRDNFAMHGCAVELAVGE